MESKIKELKEKINNLILNRKQAIIDKYNNLPSPNMKLSLEQIEQCSRELIEDTVIVGLTKQLIDIEQKTVNRYIKLPNDINFEMGKLTDILFEPKQ